MATSPDKFYPVRENLADIKSKHQSLHLMEMKTHLLMLNEYDDQIFTHYMNLEKVHKPLPQLIAQQPEIRLKMRYLVVDYLLDIVNKFKLTSETFFTTVQLIDRYASVRIVKKSQFQLVGLCCLWISSKFHEKKQNVPTLEDLSKLCCNCYSKKLFINMETHILSSVGWCIGTNVESMLDMYIQKSKLYNAADVKLGCLYLCQLVQFYKLSLNYKLSEITGAALSLTIRALNGYQSSTLSSLEILILKLLAKPCPSSMNDHSLNLIILQLKKFYSFSSGSDDKKNTLSSLSIASEPSIFDEDGTPIQQQQQQHQQQLLTPPGSATGSIDAGVKYVPQQPQHQYYDLQYQPQQQQQQQQQQAQPQTPMMYTENHIAPRMLSTLNTARISKTNDIYPSPVEAITPPIGNIGIKRSRNDVVGTEDAQLPMFKKIHYNNHHNRVNSSVAYGSTIEVPTRAHSTSVAMEETLVSLDNTDNDDFFYEF